VKLEPTSRSSHKRPGIAFWATVVVVVALVAYPLSFGPACWIVPRLWARGLMPQRVADVLWHFYDPLRSSILPEWFANLRDWYSNLFIPANGLWP
jgi:hypothetical protein